MTQNEPLFRTRPAKPAERADQVQQPLFDERGSTDGDGCGSGHIVHLMQSYADKAPINVPIAHRWRPAGKSKPCRREVGYPFGERR